MSALAPFVRKYGLRLAVFVVILAVFASLSPTFRGIATVYSLFEQLAFVGLVALGIALTMLVGELDLSVASMAALMGVVAILLAPFGLVVALLGAIVGGGVLGWVQGYLIAKLGINSLVLTAGTMVLLRGFAYVFSDGKPVLVDDFAVTDPLHLRWGFLSPGSVIAVVLFALMGIFLAYTRPGRNMYATGGARQEARAAGVPVRRSLTTAFAASGALSGLAGGLACLKGGSAAPESFADLLLLGAGAAMIGGISLAGGYGSIWNVVLGVAITGGLAVGMATIAGPSYISSLVLGVLLITILVADYLGLRLRASRTRARQTT